MFFTVDLSHVGGLNNWFKMVIILIFWFRAVFSVAVLLLHFLFSIFGVNVIFYRKRDMALSGEHYNTKVLEDF